MIEYDQEFILQKASMEEKNVLPYRLSEKSWKKMINHRDTFRP
jgi:hypothetical protein